MSDDSERTGGVPIRTMSPSEFLARGQLHAYERHLAAVHEDSVASVRATHAEMLKITGGERQAFYDLTNALLTSFDLVEVLRSFPCQSREEAHGDFFEDCWELHMQREAFLDRKLNPVPLDGDVDPAASPSGNEGADA